MSAPLMAALPLASLLLAATPAAAQAPRGPTPLGQFQSWTAATHVENGQKVCYAFARAQSVAGVPGRQAENVLLLVTHRPQGRDQVAVRVGHSLPRNAEARLVVGGAEFAFYTAQDTAFARDGRAVVAALRGGREATARAPGPNGRGETRDSFPLAGFTAAHDAIGRECPAPRR